MRAGNLDIGFGRGLMHFLGLGYEVLDDLTVLAVRPNLTP